MSPDRTIQPTDTPEQVRAKATLEQRSRQRRQPHTAPPFVQIAIAESEDNISVYALDHDGRVWTYLNNGVFLGWRRLPDTIAS